MMVNPLGDIADSSILAIIADRAESADLEPTDPAEFTDVVARLKDPEAKRVAELLIARGQPTAKDSPRVRDAVQGFRDWVRRNRTVHAPIATSRGRSR